MGQPGDVLRILHFHVGNLSPHFTLAIMNKFQWRGLYKQPQNSNDKGAKQMVIDQLLKIIFR